MASFISSFKERSVPLFILAAIVTLATVWVNNAIPDPSHGASRQYEAFWQHKVFDVPEHGFNIVATGDSRVYRGFSPQVIESALPGLHAYNYGFSSGGHNAFIFRNIEKLLTRDPHGLRAVILGVSPYSLTPKAQTNSQYNDVFRKGPVRWDDAVNDFFRAINVDRIKEMIRGPDPKPSNATYDYLDNGYVRSDWLTRNPESELKVFATDFDGNTVSPDVITGVMEQTRKWTNEGIIVIGYRPPTTKEMEAVEAAHSRFNEKAFIGEFRKAGGIWVDLDNNFESYDGSHLTPESTDKLSKILAQAIAGASKSP